MWSEFPATDHARRVSYVLNAAVCTRAYEDAIDCDVRHLRAGGQAHIFQQDQELTPSGWVNLCRERIAQRDHDVSAWAYLPEREASEQRPPVMPVGGAQTLFGMPFGVKDVIDVAGMPTRCNSAVMNGHVAKSDAVAVARLRAAGAIPIGKTVTTEFAFVRPGPTRNPHDLSRTPGGSSSGSAAAVADGHVPIALTTQTGGSTIRPAAYCGVVGYKPPVGTVPLSGLQILDPSIDTIGLHAGCVADIAHVATVLERRARSPGPSSGLTFLVLSLGEGPGSDQRNREFLELCEDRLRGSGQSVQQTPIPFDRARLDDCHRTVMSAAVARSFGKLRHEQLELLSPELLQFIERGQRHTSIELADAFGYVQRVHEKLDEVCGRDAVIVWPAATGEAPVGLAATGDSSLNRPWSLLGYGVMTVPAGHGCAGMPLGLQVVDPRPGAPALFAAAYSAEQALRHKPILA